MYLEAQCWILESRYLLQLLEAEGYSLIFDAAIKVLTENGGRFKCVNS